jgi:Ca-activated chloride channel family protein
LADIRFFHIEMFHLLWLLPGLAALFWYAAGKRKQQLGRFIRPPAQARIIVSRWRARRGWQATLFLISLIFLVIALARPAWNMRETTVKRAGRDVVFLLDVSRSMLARDLKPNRLERAKLAIADCIERLQGDRVGLVAFAGTTAIKCPLTLDYAFFKMMLDAITVDSAGRGGTMIGDALRAVMEEVFDSQEKEYKDIILITDGGDQESFPVQAAEAAGKQGIRLLVIGLGDENEGERIPVTREDGSSGFLTYNGQEVWTKLDGDTLRQMALATPGGRYLPVATGTIDLGDVYQDIIAASARRELESKTIRQYEEKFQLFLAVALVLLLLESLLPEKRLS